MQMRQLALASLAVGLTGLGPVPPIMAAGSPRVTVVEEEATDIRYTSGGVSLEDRERLEREARNFDLKLVFAEPDGDYLAGVPVVIEDHHGNTILRATSRGPWFYTELPPGQYVVAIPGGHYRRSITIPGYGQKEVVIRGQEVLVERPRVARQTVVETPTITRETIVEKPLDTLQSCTHWSAAYSDGSLLCQNGYQYRCDDGMWESRGYPC